MFDEKLVDAVVGGKDADGGAAELSVNLVLSRPHGSLLLDLMILPARRWVRTEAAKLMWRLPAYGT
jgi:hypothetical protein